MKNDVNHYLRYHPHWYITLVKYPEKYQYLLDEMKDQDNKKLMDKLDQISLLIQMMEMLR